MNDKKVNTQPLEQTDKDLPEFLARYNVQEDKDGEGKEDTAEVKVEE